MVEFIIYFVYNGSKKNQQKGIRTNKRTMNKSKVKIKQWVRRGSGNRDLSTTIELAVNESLSEFR